VWDDDRAPQESIPAPARADPEVWRAAISNLR